MLHHHRRPVKNSSYLNMRSVATDSPAGNQISLCVLFNLERNLLWWQIRCLQAERNATIRDGEGKTMGKIVLGLLVCLSLARSALRVMTNINCSVSARPNYGGCLPATLLKRRF